MKNVRIAAMLILLGLARVSLAETTVVTVTGAEQQALSNGVFDKGSFTVTIGGFSETVGYGQFSTNASLASGIAAKFAQDCNSTVFARASGAVVTFVTKDPAAAMGIVVATLAWDGQDFSAASFALNTPVNALPAFTPGINCSPSTIVSGQNLTCDVTLLVGASSPVTFSVGGSVWTSVIPDTAGSAVANAAVTKPFGTYIVAYSYPGDANVPPASGSVKINVSAAGTTTAPSGNSIYSFSIGDQYGNGYTPNSNINAYTDSVNGTWSLGYDNLNRLTSSTQTAANGISHWGCWEYDSFGNMQTQGISNQAFSNLASCQAQSGANTLQSRLSYSTANQISSGTWLDVSNNTHTGAPIYDTAGEMTSDLLNNYLYDAQGQVCAVQTGPNGYTGYLYDAEGHRVAKGTLPSLTCDPTNLTITSYYFIGPDDATMTEIDGNGGFVRTDVSAAAQFLATYTPSGIHYPVTDWIGSKRVTVNPNLTLNNGVEEACASFPFGDQQHCTTPIDTSPRHFTGKERDTISGLDYFSARFYSSSMGRFSSPDPSGLTYADPTNPQSQNQYAYVASNPLIFIDPNGLLTTLLCEDATSVTTWEDGEYMGSASTPLHCTMYDDGSGPNSSSGYLAQMGLSSAPLPVRAPNSGRRCIANCGKTGPTDPTGYHGEPSPCMVANLNGVNATFNLGLTMLDNVLSGTIYNGGLNVLFTVPGGSMNSVPVGRYPLSLLTRVSGIGRALHVPGPNSVEGVYDYNGGAFLFNTHIDTAYATWHTPLGAAIHGGVDVLDSGAFRTPCGG